MNALPWLTHDAAQRTLTLRLHLQPNARSTGAAGLHGEALKVRIAAPPADDKANRALMAWLSDELDVAVSRITIARGAHDRRKTIVITQADAGVAARAAQLAG